MYDDLKAIVSYDGYGDINISFNKEVIIDKIFGFPNKVEEMFEKYYKKQITPVRLIEIEIDVNIILKDAISCGYIRNKNPSDGDTIIGTNGMKTII